MFFNSILACAALYALYRKVTLLRIRSKARPQRPENFTVMVRDVPRRATEQELFAFFDRAFPGQVAHVQRGYHTPGLWKVTGFSLLALL